MTYYIYHIPGVKYGATQNMEYRAKKGNYIELYGSNSWEIVRVCKTAEEADVVERELNIQAGYEWNESRSYLNMLAFAAKGGRKPGCTFSDEHKQSLGNAKRQPKEIVDLIRNDINIGKLSFRAIARKFKVSPTCIYNIRDKKKGY